MAVLSASLSRKACLRPPLFVAGLLLFQGVGHRLAQPGQPVLEQVVGGALASGTRTAASSPKAPVTTMTGTSRPRSRTSRKARRASNWGR